MDRIRRGLASFRRAEFLFVWFGLTISILLLLHGHTVPGRLGWVLFHLAFVPAAWLVSRLSVAWLRVPILMVWVLTCFMSMGFYLPDLVPEPFQWQVMALNESVGGLQVAQFFARPPAWLVEICVICYSTFYFLPVLLTLVLVHEKNWLGIRHLILLIAGGFLLSYLGYVCWPTLPPYRFLVFEQALSGGPLYPVLDRWLYEGEALRQDCMPSGHTMMMLLILYLAWIHSRRHLLWLTPIALFLILGTLVLRYHWFVDLLVALPFLLLALYLFDDPEARAKARTQSRIAPKLV